MLIDVHAHYWPDESGFSPGFLEEAQRARGGPVDLVTDYDHYWQNATRCEVGKVILFGGKARRSGLWQGDEVVARKVAAEPDRYLGFLSVDLTQPGWRDELEHGHQSLKLSGVKLLPMYAGFYPQDRQYDDFWAYISRHRLPVLLHSGTTFISQAPLDCTLPRHLDEVAMRFPQARIILAHLGHPYEGEALVVARKHRHVYTDISALHYRPWQLFHSLMLASEYNVWPKLLFGTDYPFTTVDATLAGLERLAAVEIGGFRLPPGVIEALIARDTLALLFE